MSHPANSDPRSSRNSRSPGTPRRASFHHSPPKPAEMVKQIQFASQRMFRNSFIGKQLRKPENSRGSLRFTTGARCLVKRPGSAKANRGNDLRSLRGWRAVAAVATGGETQWRRRARRNEQRKLDCTHEGRRTNLLGRRAVFALCSGRACPPCRTLRNTPVAHRRAARNGLGDPWAAGFCCASAVDAQQRRCALMETLYSSGTPALGGYTSSDQS